MPTVLAASTISVAAGTVTLCPSMVRLMSGMCKRLADVAGVPEGVVLVLLAEVAESRVDDPARGVAEPAQAAAVLEAVRDALEDAQLELRALVGQDALVGPHRPVAADAARRALATGLVRIELEQPVGGPDHAVRVVHHDHAARSTHRAGGGESLHVGVGVEHALGQHRGRRAAGPEDFHLAAFRRAAGQLHDHVAERLAELDLVHAPPAHVATDRHEARAGGLLSAELRVSSAAVVDDP